MLHRVLGAPQRLLGVLHRVGTRGTTQGTRGTVQDTRGTTQGASGEDAPAQRTQGGAHACPGPSAIKTEAGRRDREQGPEKRHV